MQNLADATTKAVQSGDDWVSKLKESGVALNVTDKDLRLHARHVMEIGGTYEQFAQSSAIAAGIIKRELTGIVVTGANTGGTLERIFEPLGEDIPKPIETAVKKVKQDLGALVGISKTTLSDVRDEIKSRMKDIQDALTHPFRADKLEKEYRQGMRRAQAAMNKAMREGNKEAYADAKALYLYLRGKVRQMDQLQADIDIEWQLKNGFGTQVGDRFGLDNSPTRGPKKPKKHATGLDYVPFDNYPALLHKGERVMTAAENRGGGSTSNYSISVHVAPGGDLVETGRQVVRAIQEYEKRGGRTWRTA
jgi:hypothetical protein